MLDHPPENPFVPQISISTRAGAIFELRIHSCGLASDVDVVPYTDKLFISGNVQPCVQMRRTDYHAVGTHSEGALVWSDQPYGRFGRGVPAPIKPGTECVILERAQEGDDYVIHYTVRNIKQRQQLANYHMDTSYNGNSSFTPYFHGWDLRSDRRMNMPSPRQTYHEEYIQESVFASNFTNSTVSSTDAFSVFEGISQSFGVARSTTVSNIRYTDIQRRFYQMPLQDMGASTFCNHEALTGAYISDNMNIPVVPPASCSFGLEPSASSIGPHVNPSLSMEVPYPPVSTSHIYPPEGELSSSVMPMPVSVCPPMALNAGTSASSLVVNNPPVMHVQSSTPIFTNAMMDTSSFFDNTHRSVHRSTNNSYPDNYVILGTVPPGPAAWVQPLVLPAAASVEVPSSQSHVASAGVAYYTVPTEPYPVFPAPSNANIIPSTTFIPSAINPLPHPIVNHLVPRVSVDASRDISGGTYQDGSIPSVIPTSACPAHSVTKSNISDISVGMQHHSQDISAVEGVIRTDGHISSTSAIDSLSRSDHTAYSLQEQGMSGSIEVAERDSSLPIRGSGAAISPFPMGTFGGGIHFVIEERPGMLQGMQHHSRDISTIEGVTRTDGHFSSTSGIDFLSRSDRTAYSQQEQGMSGSIEVAERDSSLSIHGSGAMISPFPMGMFGGGVHFAIEENPGMLQAMQHHSRDISTVEGVTRSDSRIPSTSVIDPPFPSASYHEQGISGSIEVTERATSHSTHGSGTVIPPFPMGTFGGGVHSVVEERQGSSRIVTRTEETHQSSVGVGEVSISLPEVPSVSTTIPRGTAPAPHMPSSSVPFSVPQPEPGTWTYNPRVTPSASFPQPVAPETHPQGQNIQIPSGGTVPGFVIPTVDITRPTSVPGTAILPEPLSRGDASGSSSSLNTSMASGTSRRGEIVESGMTRNSSAGLGFGSGGSVIASREILTESESARIDVSARETLERESTVVRDVPRSKGVRFSLPAAQNTTDVEHGSPYHSETRGSIYVAPNVESYSIVSGSSSALSGGGTFESHGQSKSSSAAIVASQIASSATSTSIVAQETTSSSERSETLITQSSSSGIQDTSNGSHKITQPGLAPHSTFTGSESAKIDHNETVGRAEGTIVRDVPRSKEVRFSLPAAQSTTDVEHESTYFSDTRDTRYVTPNVKTHSIVSGSSSALSGGGTYEAQSISSGVAVVASEIASSATSTSIVGRETTSSSEQSGTLTTQSSSSGIQDTSNGSYTITQLGLAPSQILPESESTRINVSVHETVEQESAVVRDVSTSEHVVPAIQGATDVKHESTLFSETRDGRYVTPNVGSHSITSASSSALGGDGAFEVESRSSGVTLVASEIGSSATSTSIVAQETTSSSTSASVVAQETTSSSTSTSIVEQETTSSAKSETSTTESSSSGIQDTSTIAVSTTTRLEAQGTLLEAEGHATSMSGQSIDGSTALGSETTTELGNSSAVLADISTGSSQEASVVNVGASSTANVLGTIESRASVPADAASVVIPALTAAAVDVVQNVMKGESFTEALKHSAGSLVRNVGAGALGVQDASISREKEIVESTSSSSNQTGTVVGEVSVSESSIAHLEDRSGTEAAGMTIYSSSEEEQVAGERFTLHTGQTVESGAKGEEISQSQAQVGIVEAASQSKDVVAGTIATHITTSAAEHSSALQTSSTIDSTTTTLETGLSSSQAEAVVKSVSYSSAGIELDTGIASGIEQPRFDNTATISDSRSVTEQIASGVITSVNEGVSQGHSMHEATTVASSTTGKSTKSETEGATDVTVQAEAAVIDSGIARSSYSRDVEVKTTAEVTAETHAVDTIATSSGEVSITSTANIAASELQTQSQSQSQVALVRDEVTIGSRVEGDEASGAQSSAPADSNIVPVPAPSNPIIAFQTSTRQDVVLETQSNISNLSVTPQSVIGQTQSQEGTAESLSLGRGVSTSIEGNLTSSREDMHTDVVESYQTGAAQTSSAVEISGEVTSRQQEKQPQFPSVIFLEPSSPVDVVVSVPTPGSSSSKSVIATRGVEEQSTTTRVEEVAASASSTKFVSSSAELKDIEAQASVRAMPALTASPPVLKDASYTPTSMSSHSQYDPPPAYSPARSNTLFGQSTVTNLERDINVSTNTQVQVDRSSSLRSHSERVVRKAESSLAAEETLTALSSATVKGTKIQEATSSIPVVSSEIYPRQRPSFIRGSSSFSDYVNIYPEESTDREVDSSSDSSNSSVVRVKDAEGPPKRTSESHTSDGHTGEPSLYLEGADVFVRERFQVGTQQTEEQVMRQSETLESTVQVDAGQTAVVASAQGNTLSDSTESFEKGADSFIDIVQEERTGPHESVVAKNFNKKSIITTGETAESTSKSSSLETIYEDGQLGESPDNQTELYSSRKASTGSIESTRSDLEAGFLQHLHQDAAYTGSSSELRSKSIQDQETAEASYESHSKQDLNDSIELDYVDVRIDRSSSSESISDSTSQTETQVATHAYSNLSSQAVRTTPEIPQSLPNSSQDQSAVEETINRARSATESDTVVTSSLQNTDVTYVIQGESFDSDSSRNIAVTQVSDVVATSNVSSTEVSQSLLESAQQTSNVNVRSEQEGPIASQEIAGTQVVQNGVDGIQSLPEEVPATLAEISTTIITSSELEPILQTAAESQGRSENTDTSIVMTSTNQGSRDTRLGHSEVTATTLPASNDLYESSTQLDSISQSSALKAKEDELSTSAAFKETTSTISESVTLSGSPDEPSDGDVTLSSIGQTNVESINANGSSIKFAATSSEVQQETTIVAATSDVREIEEKIESTTLAVSQQTEHDIRTLATNFDQSTNTQFLVSAAEVDTNSSTTLETSTTSEQQSSDRELSQAHSAVASGINMSHEDAIERDISTIHTGGEEASSSQSLKTVVVEGAAKEIERYDSETSIQQTQISAQSSRSKTTEVTIEQITPVSIEERHATEAAAEEVRLDVSEEGHLNVVEETHSKVDDSTSVIGNVQEEHEMEITTEAHDTTIHHAVEVIKTVDSAEDSAETILETSGNATKVQNSANTQDLVTELTIAKIEDSGLVIENSLTQADIQDTAQTSHTSTSTTAETTVEAVDTPVATSTAQITVSEALHSYAVSNSAASISEEIIQSSDNQDIVDKETVGSSTLVTATEMDSTVTSTVREEGIQQTTAPIEPTVETVDVQAIQTETLQQATSTIQFSGETQEIQHVSDTLNTDLVPSDIAETYAPSSSSSAVVAPVVTGTHESESTIDISTTESLDVQTGAVTQERSQSSTFASGSTHDEDSTTSIETPAISSAIHETVNAGISTVRTTIITEGRASAGASEESTTNLVIQTVDSSSEAEKTDIIIPTVQETLESEGLGDSAVEIAVQGSEVEVANSSMDNLAFTYLESKPEVSFSHQEDSHEEDRMMVPSRRDSFVTTSEDSNETTGTVRPFEPTPSGTPIRKIFSLQSPSKSTLAEAKVTVAGSLLPIADSGDKRTESVTGKESRTAESSLIMATHGEEEVQSSFVHVDTKDLRRNFAPTVEEVPKIDVAMDSPVDFHDVETALTIDVQTVTGYSDSRPVSFYSADDKTVNLYTPTDDGDSASTVFHSGSEGTPASGAMTSTAEDFFSMTHSEMGDTFISSPSITERQPAISPEFKTSPPVPFTPATTASFDQRNNETRETVEAYSSSTTNQETKIAASQEMSFARNESGSGWAMFDPSAAFSFVKTGGTGFTGKKKTSDFVPMKKF